MNAVLRGPADADHYRTKVGRYHERWYVDPLPADDQHTATTEAWPAFSTIKGAHGKDWTLVGLGRAAADFDRRRQVYADAQDREAVYKMFRNANDRGLDVAGGRGTIVHWWFEDGLNDRDLRVVSDFALEANRLTAESRTEAEAYRPAVQDFFDTYQPKLLVAETVCIHRDLNGVGYGCTADAGMLIEGDECAGDWKSRNASGDHACYPEDAMQVGGAFCGAQYMIVDDGNGGAKRVPVPKFACGLIVSIKPDGFRVYPVDIDKATQQYAKLHEWWKARRDERDPIGRSWAPKSRKAAATTPLDVAPAPAAAPAGGAGDGRRDALLARFHALNDDERRAFRDLGIDPDDLDAVEAALDQVDGFANPPANLNEPRQRPVRRQSPPSVSPPAEGTTISDDDVKAFKARARKLSDVAKMWISALFAEAKKADVPFNVNQMHSLRRFEACRGLAALAEWMPDEDFDGAGEIVRAIVHTITQTDAALFPSIPLGAVVGALDDQEAIRFAALVDDLGADRLVVIFNPGGITIEPRRLHVVT